MTSRSREIKFRAWDTRTKYMAIQGTPDIETLSSFAHHWMWDDASLFNEDIVLMQYTGLKDKNGVEIYEEDVVRYAKNPDLRAIKVRYDEEFAGYWPLVSTSSGYSEQRFEVIGNIYENPERLK